jgi:hypothetical protein
LASPEPVHTSFQVALGVLGEMPCRHVMVTAGHPNLWLEIHAAEEGWLRCSQPRTLLAVGDELTVVVGDGHRAGYEVGCAVAEVGPDSSMRLAVLDVRRVKPRRRHARRDVSESGLVRPPDGERELDVHVVDIGPDGVAFVSARRLAVGDSVSGMLNIGHRAFPIRARVIHVHSLGFGRVRTGCQFTELAEADRVLLDQVAKQAPVDRRGLRPIELLGNGANSPWASLEDLTCDYGATALPAPRYCRPCGRVTLQRDTASPGNPPEWRCPTC